MRDPMRDLEPADTDLDAERACCPGGMRGSIFETPLLELAFVTWSVAGRQQAWSRRPRVHPLSTSYPPLQTVAAAPPHPREDAPRD